MPGPSSTTRIGRTTPPLEVRGPDGLPLPFQVIETENNYFTQVPWRRRVVVPMTLPPLGWSVVTLGWVKSAGNRCRRRCPRHGPIVGYHRERRSTPLQAQAGQ